MQIGWKSSAEFLTQKMCRALKCFRARPVLPLPKTEAASDSIRVFRSEQIETNVETCYRYGSLGPLARYERLIRLVFSDGSDDVLHYSAVGGSFEYDGVKCNGLRDEEMTVINDALIINTGFPSYRCTLCGKVVPYFVVDR